MFTRFKRIAKLPLATRAPGLRRYRFVTAARLQVLLQRRDDVFELDGLREEIVHPGVNAFIPATYNGLGRQRDDRDSPVGTFQTSQLCRGFIPIHFGHLAVHKDDVVGNGF